MGNPEFTHIKIEKELAESLLKYLASKPLEEVVELWDKLRRSEPVLPETAEITEDK
jgi:hypothetical protein